MRVYGNVIPTLPGPIFRIHSEFHTKSLSDSHQKPDFFQKNKRSIVFPTFRENL